MHFNLIGKFMIIMRIKMKKIHAFNMYMYIDNKCIRKWLYDIGYFFFLIKIYCLYAATI